MKKTWKFYCIWLISSQIRPTNLGAEKKYLAYEVWGNPWQWTKIIRILSDRFYPRFVQERLEPNPIAGSAAGWIPSWLSFQHCECLNTCFFFWFASKKATLNPKKWIMCFDVYMKQQLYIDQPKKFIRPVEPRPRFGAYMNPNGRCFSFDQAIWRIWSGRKVVKDGKVVTN